VIPTSGRPRSDAAFAGVLLDWRGTLVIAPTYPWLVGTALQRLDRQASPPAVEAVLSRLRAVDSSEVESSTVDTLPALHRSAYLAWFDQAGIDEELAEELYAVESDASLNPFAHDVGPLLEELHAAGVRIGVVSDIHVDLRPLFAAHRTSDGSTWAGLVHTWVLSFEVGVAKPDPAIFMIALQRLDLAAESVLMVGDRGTHDGAASEVGMTTLLLPTLRAVDDLRLHRVLDLVLPGATLTGYH
jgi:HAD superfamily hydrolase (TIGR01549 family)